MKLGLKIWSTNTESFNKLIELYNNKIIDFIELYIIPKTLNTEDLSILKNIPIIFHAPNFNHSFNIRNQNNHFKETLTIIKEYFELFEKDQIVIHPGYTNSKDYNLKLTEKGIKEFKKITSNIYIENMPSIGIKKGIFLTGNAISEIEYLKNKFNLNFVIDIGHTICSANYKKINPIKYIEDFLKLNPTYCHISDGELNSVIDQHLSFKEGDYPLKEILNLIKKSSIKKITLETSKKGDLKNLTEDIRNIKYLKNLLNSK